MNTQSISLRIALFGPVTGCGTAAHEPGPDAEATDALRLVSRTDTYLLTVSVPELT